MAHGQIRTGRLVRQAVSRESWADGAADGACLLRNVVAGLDRNRASFSLFLIDTSNIAVVATGVYIAIWMKL